MGTGVRRAFLASASVILALSGLSEPAAAASGRQVFMLTQQPGEQPITVIAAGPIRGVGTDVIIRIAALLPAIFQPRSVRSSRFSKIELGSEGER